MSNNLTQSINQIFELFLAERKKDLAPRTFGYYEEAINLMGHCFNGYGHMDLDEAQNKILEEKNKQGVEFCDCFGSEVLDFSLLSEFLGYFLPKKVCVGADGARKICGASLNFYKWLVDNGLVVDDMVKETVKDLRDNFNFYWQELNQKSGSDDYF